MTPEELTDESVEELRAQLGLADPAGAGAAVEDPAPATPPPARRAPKAMARALARRTLAPVARRAARTLAAQLGRRPELAELTAPELASLRDRHHAVQAEVAALRAEVQAAAPGLAQLALIGPTAVAAHDLAGRLSDLNVNLELLKAELRAVDGRINELGLAIAPAAGLPGAASRLAELRERLNAIDRRLRSLAGSAGSAEAAGSGLPEAATGDSSQPSTPQPVSGGDRFDYVGFEARFRGDTDTVLAAQRERYLEVLRRHSPVLDIGCGRGELLAVLAAEGIEASGVDLNAEMVAEAQGQGLAVTKADAVAHLRSLPEGALGSIIAVHVVEHLQLDDLVELLELAASRLRPGGVLIAETPNPASLIVLGNSYILDPTHVWPLHPSLLTFLCERAGFRSVEQRYYAPAEAYHLPRLQLDAEAPPWAAQVDAAIESLNRVLFGPQEYAVVATTPPS